MDLPITSVALSLMAGWCCTRKLWEMSPPMARKWCPFQGLSPCSECSDRPMWQRVVFLPEHPPLVANRIPKTYDSLFPSWHESKTSFTWGESFSWIFFLSGVRSYMVFGYFSLNLSYTWISSPLPQRIMAYFIFFFKIFYGLFLKCHKNADLTVNTKYQLILISRCWEGRE